MPAFFGRRHSVSEGSGEDDSISRQFIRRRASAPNLYVQENRFQTKVRDFFRRRTKHSQECSTSVDAPSPSESTLPRGRTSSQVCDDSVHENARQTDSILNLPSSQLTISDIEVIFSGAPYFLLEKGKQDQWYPHVTFPFDDHDPTIQSLWDRRALPYPSYTLCTLHAHLPVPSEWMIEGDTPVQLDSRKRTRPPKRASLDLGMFEVPNMLSMNGKEPGSVGFHYFLEKPVADSVRFTGPPQASAEADFLRLSNMPAMEAYELLEHHSEPYALCKDGTVTDRKRLLLGGPSAWKRIGVRDIQLKHLVGRLQTLKDLRNDILHGETAKTILDLEGTVDLFNGLFTNFLYPPPRFTIVEGDGPHSLQSQIKALTVVLATPGAWFDFSLPEWRLRVGQILWEAPPHADGDFLDPLSCDKPWVYPSMERKWFLVQMVLAAELLLRLDATVRVGLLQSSHRLQISSQDIQDFERLRNAKVNWDMVAVRRLMDSSNFVYRPIQSEAPQATQSAEAHEPSEKSHQLFTKYFHKTVDPVKVHESAWACNFTPEYIDRQLQGLLLFAEHIDWPGITEMKKRFQSIYQNGDFQRVKEAYNQPIDNVRSTTDEKNCGRNTMYSRSLAYRPLLLRYTNNDRGPIELGGWVTRTWLSGLVFPGEGISHLLMASTLENDVEAMDVLGPVANLYGGFSYRGRSWWSQECIVGRVLSSLPGTNICMGWLGSGDLPKESRTMEPLGNTWFAITVIDPPSCPGPPRIKQGKKISHKSTPLGIGNLTSGAFSLPVDSPDDQLSKVKIEFQSLVFDVEDEPPKQQQAGNKQRPLMVRKTTMNFSFDSDQRRSPKTISFPLLYNVLFISSHECRPPGGLILYRTPGTTARGRSSSASSSPTRRRHLPRLPGHPLHHSYTYKVIPLESLSEMSKSENRSVTTGFNRARTWHEIMVLDARGGPEQEAFARGWCASVGCHAIVGRVGRTCLACCIREARAVKVRVVIRVSGGPPDRPLLNDYSSSDLTCTAKQ